MTRREAVALAAIFGAAAVGFLLCEPYLILDWRDWCDGFTFQVRAYLPADNLGQMWDSLTRQLSDFSTSDASLLGAGVLGSAYMIINPVARRRAWLLVLFPVIYVLAMSRFSLTYVRNMIVTMPFLALIAGYLIDTVAVQLVTMARGLGASLPMSQSRRLWGAARWALVVVALLLVAWEPLRISWAFSNHCDSLGMEGKRLLWGPVRHGPGFNLATYLPDPDGGLIEVYADLVRIYDERAYEPVDWDAVPDALNLWGPPPPEEIFTAGLPVLPA